MSKEVYAKVGKTAKSGIHIYSTLAIANAAASRGHKPRHVILGDEGDYLVVTPAVGARIVKAGYQYA